MTSENPLLAIEDKLKETKCRFPRVLNMQEWFVSFMKPTNIFMTEPTDISYYFNGFEIIYKTNKNYVPYLKTINLDIIDNYYVPEYRYTGNYIYSRIYIGDNKTLTLLFTFVIDNNKYYYAINSDAQNFESTLTNDHYRIIPLFENNITNVIHIFNERINIQSVTYEDITYNTKDILSILYKEGSNILDELCSYPILDLPPIIV